MSSIKLKKATLKEVIFELHWDCTIDSDGENIDHGFDLAHEKFSELLIPDFPIQRNLNLEGAQTKIIGAPIIQFWTGEYQWPVVQHGKGMIAINENELGYEWNDKYKPLVLKIIEKLEKSYEQKLEVNKIGLMYIDAFDIDNIDPVDFIIENLQTGIKIDYPMPGKRTGINFQQTFELDNQSFMVINITTGINNSNQNNSIIWTTKVEKKGNLSFDQIESWIDFAHDSCSQMFKKMLNPKFYASLT